GTHPEADAIESFVVVLHLLGAGEVRAGIGAFNYGPDRVGQFTGGQVAVSGERAGDKADCETGYQDGKEPGQLHGDQHGLGFIEGLRPSMAPCANSEKADLTGPLRVPRIAPSEVRPVRPSGSNPAPEHLSDLSQVQPAAPFLDLGEVSLLDPLSLAK